MDAIDFADWYDLKQAGLGHRFLLALDTLIATLDSQPRRFPRVARCPKNREVRQARVPKFPVIAVYEIMPAELLVVSLTHARSIRQPWRKRLPDPP
jgi:hypothetical protein